MKQYVDSGDFERYIIPLPRGALFGKKRESYIRSQLVKRHPCFSDSCCFDARYSFSGREVAVNAVVMDKVVLSRYRLKYPGKTLSVKIFQKNTNAKMVDMHVFRHRSIIVPAVITPVVLSALIFGVFQPQQGTIPDTVTDSVIVQEMPAIFYPQISVLLNELFEVINEAGNNPECIISRFEFLRQNGSESVSMELSGIYPESVRQFSSCPISFSKVTYHEGVPAFSLSFVSKYGETKVEQESFAADIVPSLRKIITESGGTMIQESTGQGEVKFRTPAASFMSLMNGLEELRINSKAGVQKFSLNSRGGNQNSEFEGLICVDIDKNPGNFSFKPFTEYPGLFTKYLPKPQIAKTANKGNRNIPVSYSKIGEIQEGGKKCVFYRTPEGKIVRYEQ